MFSTEKLTANAAPAVMMPASRGFGDGQCGGKHSLKLAQRQNTVSGQSIGWLIQQGWLY
jgi:hypothetical protein